MLLEKCNEYINQQVTNNRIAILPGGYLQDFGSDSVLCEEIVLEFFFDVMAIKKRKGQIFLPLIYTHYSREAFEKVRIPRLMPAE